MLSPALASPGAQVRVRWAALGAALGVSVVGGALPLVALVALRPSHEIRATAIWGAIVLLAFAGWGDLVKRHLAPDVDVDWGLRATWGLAVTVAAGGLFCLVGLARRPILVAWICGGVALAAQAALLRRRRFSAGAGAGATAGAAPDLGWDAVLAGGIVCATLFVYLGAAGHTYPNPSDDWPAYLSLARKLLQTGSLIEPFSVRRMAAYGGQTLLQAFTLVVARDTQVQIFDGGICLVLTIGLILGFAREARNVTWTVLLLTALAVLMLPDDRANSASEMSGVVGFVALWRTLTLIERRQLRGPRAALLAALPAAAVSTLRQNYLLTVVAMLFALCLRGGRQEDAGARPPWAQVERLRFFWQVALLSGACLLPWAALAWRSNHTFLFPIFHGNYHPETGGITFPATWDVRLKVCFAAAFHDEPVHTLPLVLLALPAIAGGANRRASLGLWLGTMAGFALLSWSLPGSDSGTIARYGLASVVALSVVAGLAAADGGTEILSKRGLLSAGLVVAALALQIYGTHGPAVKSLNSALDRIRSVDQSPDAVTAAPERERHMQAAVPPGARLLVMIDRPFLLDFARNPIEILDQPGAASPWPGIPLTEGADRVAAYLRARGVRYFAFVRPDKADSPLYNRAQWIGMLAGGSPLWHATAPINLATFDVVDRLAQRGPRLYDDGRLVVVDLGVSG